MKDPILALELFYGRQPDRLPEDVASRVSESLAQASMEIEFQDASDALRKILPAAAVMLAGLIRGQVDGAEVSEHATRLDSAKLFASTQLPESDDSCEM